MNSLPVILAKQYLMVSAVLTLLCLALPVNAQGQELIQEPQAAPATERQQRIQELRQLQREERAERCQAMSGAVGYPDRRAKSSAAGTPANAEAGPQCADGAGSPARLEPLSVR